MVGSTLFVVVGSPSKATYRRTMVGIVLLSTLLVLGCSVDAGKIPRYVQVCKKSDPQYVECVLKSIENIRPRLAKGIPKMQVPPAEPFVLPALQIDRDLESLKIKAHLENVQAFGGSAFIVDKLSVDPHKLTLAMTVTVPSLYVVTDYDVNGRLLLVPLRGKGVFKGNFTNTKVDVKGNGKLITKNGVQFIQLEKIQSKLKVGGMAFKFENKDKSNALITTTASNFINENQRQVLDIVTPIVQETMDEVITQFGDRILGSIPYSEILPE